MSNENMLSYVNYDFNSLTQELINRVKSSESWKDTYRSSTGQMLIELYAYVANLILYYVERRAEEAYIDTARLRSSIIRLVRLLNYIPQRKVSSTGILVFSLSSPATKKIFIPKYTECQTASGAKYLVSEDVVLMPGQSSVNANAIQGYLVETVYTGTGELNQSYQIDSIYVENSNLFIYVDDELWSQVSSFAKSTNTSKEYTVTYELNDKLTLQFGDNVQGMAPLSGQRISVRYISSLGLSGNVYDSGRITQINSTIFDEDETAVTMSVTNDVVFLGGDDEESIEEIRYEAPRVFKTGDRAVNKEDYIAILENYPSIATANVWGEAEVDPPNYDYFNRVNITILLQQWQDPSSTFKSELSTYLQSKAMLTVKYEYVSAAQILVIPTFTQVKVVKGNNLSYVQSLLETAITDQFDLGNTTKLGISKRISDLVAIADNVDGVAYHHMYLLIKKEMSSSYLSTYDFGALLDAVPLLPEAVKIYVGSTQVGEDDGFGNMVSSGSIYTVSGTVNYTTGEVLVNMSPSPSETVCAYYQQNQSGDIVVTKNQICRLDSINIQNIGYES